MTMRQIRELMDDCKELLRSCRVQTEREREKDNNIRQRCERRCRDRFICRRMSTGIRVILCATW